MVTAWFWLLLVPIVPASYWAIKHRRRRYHGISLIVSFRADKYSPQRARLWNWLKRYWKYEMPDAEIVVSDSRGKVLSKAEAINRAVAKSHGRNLVLLDADCYIEGDVIQHCADEIDRAARRGHHLWFVPYRHLYRLTEEATERVLDSDPRHPYRFYSPPSNEDVAGVEGSGHGNRFGALIQIMSREAFYEVGGWDERMRGWGGEDVAFLRAMDTIVGPHKTTNNDVLHLWHATIGDKFTTRMWAGQKLPRVNENLASRYNKATGDREKMRAIIEGGLRRKRRK